MNIGYECISYLTVHVEQTNMFGLIWQLISRTIWLHAATYNVFRETMCVRQSYPASYS
jgi:hypothetical protein